LQAKFKKYTRKQYKLIDYSKNYGIMYIINDNIREILEEKFLVMD